MSPEEVRILRGSQYFKSPASYRLASPRCQGKSWQQQNTQGIMTPSEGAKINILLKKLKQKHEPINEACDTLAVALKMRGYKGRVSGEYLRQVAYGRRDPSSGLTWAIVEALKIGLEDFGK